MKKLLIIALLILGLIIIILYKTYSNMQIDNCYIKCSDYNLLGEATHWNYNDFVIDNGDINGYKVGTCKYLCA